MKKLMKLGRSTLAIALALVLVLCLCGNGLSARALDDPEAESRKDEILKEIFGDEDITMEEAYTQLKAEADTMNSYENIPFQYVPDADSYYVALGDATAAIFKPKQKTTYVDILAGKLGVEYKNLAAQRLAIQDVYSIITENTADIEKADLITIGWSNFGVTDAMLRTMQGNMDPVTKDMWIELLGEENEPLVGEMLEVMYQELEARDMTEVEGYDVGAGIEAYAYAYISNVIHQAQVIEAIRIINEDVAIILVGTYNNLAGIVITSDEHTLPLGDYMQNLINASNLMATRNAAHYGRVAYVNAPDVATGITRKEYTTSSKDIMAFVMQISGSALPTEADQTYIAEQIYASVSATCTHIWDAGVTVTEPTCIEPGSKLHTCTWCRTETKTEPIPATGEHDYGAWTDIGDGMLERQCKHCGHAEQKEASADDVVLGDADGNGKVNARDVRALLQYLADLLAEDADFNKEAADIDSNGKINARDVRALLNQLAGLA